MSLEGKEEKKVCEMVYCAGIGGMLKIDSCNDDCDHFGGIREEPIEKKNHGVVELIGCNRFVLCKYPKLEKVSTLSEV